MRRALTALLVLLALAGCTADRPAAPAPGRPAPNPAQPFGLKWNGYAYPATYGKVIDSYRGGGTFHDITWCAVERTRGRPNWTAEDKVVADALGHGYELLLRIHIGTCWASGRPASPTPRSSPSHPPADLGDYRTFVRTLVGRYAARGVHLYAIENEIDAANYWGADPAEYPAVAREGAAAVRQADPKARLTDPGLSSSSYGLAVAQALHDPDLAVAFYRSFYERRAGGRLPPAHDQAGLRAAAATGPGRRILAAHEAVLGLDRAGVFDIYQLHYYDPWSLAGQVLDHIRRRIPQGMPVEAWEVGSFWPGRTYDPAVHARETTRLTTVLLAAGVRRVVYLPLFHSPGAIAPNETWRGLYGADGVARPASKALETLRETTRSGTWHPYDDGGLRGAAVDRGATTTLVLWSARPLTLRSPPVTGDTQITTIGGAPRPWTGGPVEIGADAVVITTRAPLQSTLSWLNGTTR